MDITFATNKLGKIFAQEKALVRKYGPKMAKTIMIRMTVLKNARCLELVPTAPPPRRHQLTGDRDGEFAVDLVHPKRLVFRPYHDPVPETEDGGIDASNVTAIEILEIVDYH